ncbi:MAG: chain-length determining protein [Bacteroidaceae bacterium]|nr:chain-length determining protein [Bacteroidaceae bacterium]
MQENMNNIPPQYELEDEIDIMEYVAKLWKHRKMIIKWCCVGAFIGLVVGFSLPKTYSAGATLAPEMEQRMGSGVSSIASMMGVNVNNSLDAISYEMYPDVVHSTPFIVGLFDLPVQFERKDTVVNTTLIDYMLEYQKSPWWTPIINAPFKALGWCVSLIKGDEDEEDEVGGDTTRNPVCLSKKERAVVKYFSEAIQISVDKKSGKTQIRMKMQDPLVVYTVMEAILDNLKEYMTEYRTSKVSQDVANLSVVHDQRKADYHRAMRAYAEYADANKSVILLSAQVEREHLEQEMKLAYQVYSQVATQLEGARIREQQAKPVYAVLEPAVIPNKKSGPSKVRMLVIFTFLVGCCAAAWALFGEDLLAKVKELTKEQ